MLATRPALIRALVFLVLLVAVGCGEKDKDEIVVAKVDDREITLGYFERKMNTIPEEELPADIAVQSGREELLETMIKKEVMVMKAEELGMAEDGSVDNQARRIANLVAVTQMRNEVTEAASEVTEEEIQAYYEQLPRALVTSYMVFDFEDTAREARALVEGGEDWQAVAKRFGASDPGRNGDYTMTLRYGTVSDFFERAAFALPVGAVSEPIDSPYGYFVIRVDKVEMERVQPLDAIRDQVVESVKKQKESLAVSDFVQQVLEEYDFQINDEALQAVYDGIPEDLPLTPPYPEPDQLDPLSIDSEWLDQTLMSFADQVWTVRRYSDYFNASSIFGRPRRDGRVGGLRRSISQIAVRELLTIAAQDRGYGEEPEVEDEFRNRREQMMVMRLNEELVSNQVEVTSAEVEAWWEENKEEYREPELREVDALVCETEAECLSAEIDLAGGATWEEIVERYCVESDVRQQKGHIGKMSATATVSPIYDVVFSVREEGVLSEATELEDGRWALVRVNSITPERIPDLEEVHSSVGARLRGSREDELFDSLIEDWMQEHTIERYPGRLMDAVYAPEPRDNIIESTFGGGI